MFKKRYGNLCLFVLFIYLCLGNIPRIIHIPGFQNNDIAVTEIILYIVSLSYIIMFKQLSLVIKKNVLIIYCIVLSFCFGVLKNGFSFIPFLYSFRLILEFVVAYSFSNILYFNYKGDTNKVFSYFLQLYLFVSILSYLILVLFPSSVKLWAFFSRFGITFNGDPHVNRLVSVYLDPNFYSAIACIPIILCYALYRNTDKMRYLLFMAIISLSILLSFSRSGLVTLLFVYSISYLKELIKLFVKMNTRTVAIIIMIIAMISVTTPLLLGSVQRLLERFQGISSDQSALARLGSFDFGYQIFKDNPLFGVGSGYIFSYMKSYTILTSVDSSLLQTLINFGVIPSIILMIFFIWRAVKVWNKLKITNNNKLILPFYRVFSLYIFFCVVFTSQFNNLLYYQFWLIPVLIIGEYMSIVSNRGSKMTSPSIH